MNKPLLLAAVLLASACSRKPALNYRHCLKLRIGMTREQMTEIMGEPEETFPYVEGKTLPHLKGRTSYEWGTPASMPAPNTVTVDDAAGKITSVRCADAVITATVFVEPAAPAAPEPSGEAVSLSTAARPAPRTPPPAGPREHSTSSSRSSGRPLTQ